MTARRAPRPTARRAAAVAAAAFLVAACAGSGDTAPFDTAGAPGSSSASGLEAASATSAVATTAPVTTVPATSDPATTGPASSAPADGAPGSTAGGAGVVPGEQWETADLPAGVDGSAIDAAVDQAFGPASNQARVRSVVVVHGGRIVYERYHPLDGPDVVMESFSVAKSITSAAIGLLVGDGLVSTEAPAPVEQWRLPGDERGGITLEHLLHMASGLSWEEQYSPGSPPLEMLGSPDAAEYAAGLPLEEEPGTVFEYSTGTTAILAGILTDELGGPADADRYLQERLFGAIGMSSTRFTRDAGGTWVGGLGADSTTRDFARFGLLFARDGVWGDERVLPPGWVDYSCSPSPANAQYGAQWWIRDDGTCTARGLFGQVVLVDREHDLVIAVNTAPGGDADTLVDAVLASMRSGLESS